MSRGFVGDYLVKLRGQSSPEAGGLAAGGVLAVLGDEGAAVARLPEDRRGGGGGAAAGHLQRGAAVPEYTEL